MKEWIVKYCEDDRKEKLVMIYADTYTKALLEFAVKYPGGHYIEIMEVFGNESKVAKIVGKSSTKRKGKKDDAEQQAWLNGKMDEIFGVGNYPYKYIDKLEDIG